MMLNIGFFSNQGSLCCYSCLHFQTDVLVLDCDYDTSDKETITRVTHVFGSLGSASNEPI